MLKLRKNAAAVAPSELPLAIEVADSTLRRVFAGPQVSQLRRMLTDLFVSQRLPNRIGFASALRGEGVSYITLASAVTLAHDTGKRVCAVELNWLAPGMLANLNPPPSLAGRKRRGPAPPPAPLPALPGIAEVLRGKASLDEVLLATNHAGLWLLPAGTATIEQRPLLARSAELRALIDTLSERFDYVLLDLPAVLEVSDTLALAALADACALVVRHGVTPITDVQRALSDIQHVPVLGVILNQAHIATPRWIHRLIPQE
ncbi:chromosome partitioning protein [Chloroflexus islandicus]|uniref:Chromosome partitioning protein n=1 Tax=Chloroflexus islandicus TaxID=1707952 RepID=A0A178MDX2_9CHLR|nr:CpsD/CapB family tyrosine-protein kinase [Chloroflexus islandicus]OAN46054.1 chromosome partitioning protein [Chloroflexus islandicus]